MRKQCLSFLLASILCSGASSGQQNHLTPEPDAQSPQTIIVSSTADYAIGRLHVTGLNFSATTAPTVSFNGQQLTIISFTTTTIDAMLPAGIAPGSYLLNVICGSQSSQQASFDSTIGTAGPQGPKGDTGATGAAGKNGADGVVQLPFTGAASTTAAAFAISNPGPGSAIAGGATSGFGVTGSSNSGSGVFGSGAKYGVLASGTAAALRLQPASVAGPPSSGDHAAGELVVDSAGSLYYCRTGGTPGVWISLDKPARSAWYDVRDYGAKGDGVNDDTAAIQGAIEAAKAGSGGIVKFPTAGPYLISAPLNLSLAARVTLEGIAGSGYEVGGTRIITNSSNTSIITAHQTFGLVLRQLGFEALSPSYSGVLLDLSGAAANAPSGLNVIEHCWIAAARDATSATLLSLDDSHGNLIDRTTLRFGGVQIRGGSAAGKQSVTNRVTNCWLDQPAVASIQNPQAAWFIGANVFEPRDGVTRAIRTTYRNHGPLTIIGNFMSDIVNGVAIDVDISGGLSIIGNQIEIEDVTPSSVPPDAPVNVGIRLSGSATRGVTIHGNWIHAKGPDGSAAIDLGANQSGIAVSGNALNPGSGNRPLVRNIFNGHRQLSIEGNDEPINTAPAVMVVLNAGGQPIDSGGAQTTPIAFDGESYDIGDMHESALNPARVTIPLDGMYEIRGKVTWAPASSGQLSRELELRKNGDTTVADNRTAATYLEPHAQEVATTIPLLKGDYIELRARHYTGTQQTIQGQMGWGPTTQMTIRRVSDLDRQAAGVP